VRQFVVNFVLQPATRAVLAEMEITEPTPIQAEAIPALMAGHDLVGQSATGSGKTLAYGCVGYLRHPFGNRCFDLFACALL